MTKARDVVPWEVLNRTILHSFFKSLFNRLDFSVDGPSYSRVLPCSFFLLFIILWFSTFSRYRKRRDVRTRAALRALLAIITPTCSFWPSHYIKFASIRHLHIDIPMETFLEDTADGLIEFRDPFNDLTDLIGPGATVNGHTIRISVAWKWWTDYFEWRVLSKSKSGYRYMSGTPHTLNDMPMTNSHSLNLPCALGPPTSCPLFCLDHLPHGTIPPLNVGCKTTFEFTAFSPSLRTLSTAQIVSAIPFIVSQSSPRRPRTLVSVLKMFSITYGPNLIVDSVSNISTTHEHTLRLVYSSFSSQQEVRAMRVKSLGIKTWRRDMFLVALEAALLRRGWIERWAIQVTTQ